MLVIALLLVSGLVARSTSSSPVRADDPNRNAGDTKRRSLGLAATVPRVAARSER
jgi:hypothetical protein